MLDELHVANLGLITDARVEPGPGLVVVTGETGAGKTLLLGALRLLLGENVRRDQVGPDGEEALVEGRFVFGDGSEVAVARRVAATGRSRAYRDGTMVTATALAEALVDRVAVVAQHDHLRMFRPEGLRALVDANLGAHRALLTEYEEVWERLQRLRRDQAVIGGDRRALERELEVQRFQAEEIAAAGFEAGDDEELRRRLDLARNAEALMEGVGHVLGALDDDAGALAKLGEAAHAIHRLAAMSTEFASWATQIDELVSLVSDLRNDIAEQATDFEHDPAALDELENRAAALAALRRKYGETLDEILAYGSAAEARAAELTALLARAETLEEEVAKVEQLVAEAGERLRTARAAVGDALADRIVAHLRDLGFTEPTVRFEVTDAPPGPHGADRIELQFAADAALTPGPVGKVASGGELSRLVLATALAGGRSDEVEIYAFDEVDAGVGGATARALGAKLAGLAVGRQVLCVTHLPQVAAFADRHLVVRREGDRASVDAVTGAERVVELSRMLSGLPDSVRGREHAEELLELAARHREAREESTGGKDGTDTLRRPPAEG